MLAYFLTNCNEISIFGCQEFIAEQTFFLVAIVIINHRLNSSGNYDSRGDRDAIMIENYLTRAIN